MDPMEPLKGISRLGQSIWLDFIRRGLITSGELHRLVQRGEVRGVTSNPSIFEKAITGSDDYTNAIRGLLRQRDMDARSLYEAVAVRDIQDAADVLWPVYEATQMRDGYVSLEVSPYLARDTRATVEEARRLWGLAARPNVLIKVPGTTQGVPAIRQLIGEGINVNITLLFDQEAYVRVAEAYLAGLEQFAATGGDLHRVASVASFFVSRIDTMADAQIARRIESASSAAERERLRGLQGAVAIANARQAYRRYRQIVASPRWRALEAKGAQRQRLLWASTSAKNPDYRDVVYVEELIGVDTVNTMPPATYEAFRDHGKPRASLEEHPEAADSILETLESAGISLKEITDRVLDDGVRLFAEAFDGLLGAVEKKRREMLGPEATRQTLHLPGAIADETGAALEQWRVRGDVRRLWSGDAALWTGRDEARWLGWLSSPGRLALHPFHLHRIAKEAAEAGFTHALLLGMGGSSLCPDVLRATFGAVQGFPALSVLDSTDPAQIRARRAAIDIEKTLFIVSSKSGSTTEPNIFKQYFFDEVRRAVGDAEAGRRFIAITDPGSALEEEAARVGFRHTFPGVPEIGGRYSALSNFGMVPAAIMGLDTERFLGGALRMAHSCAAAVPPAENPGVTLGVLLGTLARRGRDKVTLVISPGIAILGAWLEQLLAESTGKQGRGIVPVDGERPGDPGLYGEDRVFVYVRLESAPDAAQDGAVDALQAAGHPVVRIAVPGPYALGGEFFRWEIATAVAGAVIGINPFDQPDVEASKVATRAITDDYEKTGALPSETPLLEDEGIRLFTDERNARALEAGAGADRSLAGLLRAHLGRIVPGDYFALLAYIEMNAAGEKGLQAIRHTVRDARHVATCLGFGPRFLHSTGQVYKGGPNTGVFLQVTCDDAADLPVPGRSYTFGVVKAAQALGDFRVLAGRERRVLRAHLGPDIAAGLERLRRAVRRAVA